MSFDEIDHTALMARLRARIKDKRVLARQWEPNPGKPERRAKKGLGNWRLCRYADPAA